MGSGDIHTVQWLITAGRSSDIKAGFLSAARHGQLAVLQVLQESGVWCEEGALEVQHILHEVAALPILTAYTWYQAGSESNLQDDTSWIDEYAVDLGYIATLKWLVYELRLSLEDRESECQKTPFLCAIDTGCLALLQALQALGADIQAVDAQGNNALHLAIDTENLVVMGWLIQAGVALECREQKDQRTPFLRAAQIRNLELLRALKSYGAEMQVFDQYGNNALHLAVLSSSRVHPCRSGEKGEGIIDQLTTKVLEVITWLLQESGLSLEAKGDHQMTAFLYAARYGCLEILQQLKDWGSDAQVVDEHGNNALHLAVLGEHNEVIRWLVQEARLDLESLGGDQKTAFLVAAEQGSLSVLKILYTLGANPNTRDSMGRDALALIHSQIMLSCETRNVVMIWLLGEVYANNSCYLALRLIGKLGEPDKPIDSLVTLLMRHRVLETLILSANHLEVENMNRLITCLGYCENLTHLDISQNHLTRPQLVELGKALMANKRLQYLGLAHNSIVNDGFYAMLQQGLATHPGITSLAIQHNKLTTDSIAWLASALQKNKILKKLHLDVALTSATFELLEALLKGGVEHILLDVQLVENGVEHLTTACVIDKRLECLALNCQELTDEQVGQLAPWLVQQLHLQTLHMIRPQLTQIGVGILREISQGWINLYQLKLGLSIKAQTFTLLLALVQGLPSLKELILYGQCNSWHELQPFMIELIQTTSLKKLDFRDVELKTIPDPTIFEAVLRMLSDHVYFEEIALPYTLILTAKQEQELQALLFRNKGMAPSIEQQRIGARRIKSVVTKRVVDPEVLSATTPSSLFFAPSLGNKRLSRLVHPKDEEEPITKRCKLKSP